MKRPEGSVHTAWEQMGGCRGQGELLPGGFVPGDGGVGEVRLWERQAVAAQCYERRKRYSFTLRLILCHVNITSIKNIAMIN